MIIKIINQKEQSVNLNYYIFYYIIITINNCFSNSLRYYVSDSFLKFNIG